MIGLSTTTQNTSGALVIKNRGDSDLRRYPKRVQRTATLDGGAVISDFGFSHGDRTLKVKADLTETDADLLLAIHQTETLLNIALEDGFFSGAIQSLTVPGGEAVEMSVLIKEKLSA